MDKNILFFNQGYEQGGTDTFLLNLVQAWPNKADRLSIWLNDAHPGLKLYQQHGLAPQLIAFPAVIDVYAKINGWRRPGPVKRLAKGLAYLSRPFLFLAAVLGFWRCLKGQGFGAVFSSNGGYPAGDLCQALVIAARLAGVRKIFLIIHNDAVPARSPFRWFESLVDWAVASCCARIITVSQACARQIETARPVFKNVLVIANGLDLGRKGRYTLEEKRQKLKIEPTAKVIGTIGNLESRKGHAYLLRAFVEVKKKCPEARLIVVGSTDSPEAAAVLALVKQLKLESSVTLTGYLDNAWEYVECFDLFVYPSVAFESFGFALLEAMRFAKPIVAAATGGIPEVVGEAGILVEPRQAGQLADAIIALLGDPACANLLAEKGAARLGALFSVERMADQYYALTGRRGE